MNKPKNKGNPIDFLFVGKKTTISELYCKHFDLNLLPEDIKFDEQEKFSHIENVDIKDAPLTIVEFQHYKIPYSDDWYIYIVFFEQLNVCAVIRYGGGGSERRCYTPIDVEIMYYDKIDLSLAYDDFYSIGPF